ncbi:TPA: LOW QUALITY PROTEIN: hypothetical protein N0F65_006265 [Lagenidium giganteum]|uniref:Uncharacterized protein n=1 Tax=Lagenidium giganteum TaxID=4803 RepID=A0AAV2Z6J0_9STRA|nr:TPA: LOW QUALITY PROTEIN: hypothetical protein N0F65_006265 [Lagenidium giganteum]
MDVPTKTLNDVGASTMATPMLEGIKKVFTTAAPQLDDERAANTKLFLAREQLVHAALTWCQHSPWTARQAAGEAASQVSLHIKQFQDVLVTQVDTFFDQVLAPAIQERETNYVNVMHDCVQQQLVKRDRASLAQQQRIDVLEQSLAEFDRDNAQLKSKLDRRIADNNKLRKEYYKQLLMLRDMVHRQKNDPRITLKALDEAIANITQGTDTNVVIPMAAESNGKDKDKEKNGSGDKSDNSKGETNASSSSMMGMRREKERWEERAKDAIAECQQLQEQLLLLKQQHGDFRSTDGDLWFMKAQSGVMERQRIIDTVYKGRCNWEDVGEAIIELLNNEMIWEAVEDSAYKEKSRVARGLEAVLIRLDALGGTKLNQEVVDNVDLDDDNENGNERSPGRRTVGRRRQSFGNGNRLVPCRACNGSGYIDAGVGDKAQGANVGDESDSYLRKTLAQVLELKSQLDQSRTRIVSLEQEVHSSGIQVTSLKNTLQQIDQTRRDAISVEVQVEMEDEVDISVDAIMTRFQRQATESGIDEVRRRMNKRDMQYEHLIVELKDTISEKDEAVASLRKLYEDTQERMVVVQRKSQREQDAYRQELAQLKTSLSLTLKHRNSAIEEKQAAVKVLLKRIDKKRPESRRTSAASVASTDTSATTDDQQDADEENQEQDDNDALDPTVGTTEDNGEVQRAEAMAKRYSDAIIRVQKEFADQQDLLKQAEEDANTEEEKRRRSNSITLGNIVVTMASHPRDLFRALNAAQQEIVSLRRASQRASTVQTDRLLTLTTHLSHMSEELCMVRKRTTAEIEFWKLECEKLQNSNKLLTTELQKTQMRLQTLQSKRALQAGAAVSDTSSKDVGMCTVCERHQERLAAIYNELAKQNQVGASASAEGNMGVSSSARKLSANEATVAAVSKTLGESANLNETERKDLSMVILDLESLYATLSSAKQEKVKRMLVQALTGTSEIPKAAPTTYVPSQFVFGASPEKSVVPRYRKKIVVRQVLMDEEVQRRRRAAIERKQQILARESSSDQSDTPRLSPELEQQQIDQELGISSFVDETGKQVHYVTTVIDDPASAAIAPHYDTDSTVSVAIKVPTAMPSEPITLLRDNEQSKQSVTDAHGPLEVTGVAIEHSLSKRWLLSQMQTPTLLNEAGDIEHDPQVINQLRGVVKHNASIKESLAVTNWKILLCHLRAFRDQNRLEVMTDETKRMHSQDRRGWNLQTEEAPDQHCLMIRSTMQKLVHYRESYLDATIRERDQLRKDYRKIQAHLVHSVSSILTSLGRKQAMREQQNEAWSSEGAGSPRRSPTYHSTRPLLPAALVHLNRVPSSQKLTTPTFPMSRSDSLRRTMKLTYNPLGGHRRPDSTELAQSDPQRSPSRVAHSSLSDGNRFSQRVMRFMTPLECVDLSIDHSLSGGILSDGITTEDAIAVQNLILLNAAGQSNPASARKTELRDVINEMYPNSDADKADGILRVPTRPQSSPADLSRKITPSVARMRNAMSHLIGSRHGPH